MILSTFVQHKYLSKLYYQRFLNISYLADDIFNINIKVIFSTFAQHKLFGQWYF